jgi:hypothetical protein
MYQDISEIQSSSLGWELVDKWGLWYHVGRHGPLKEAEVALVEM